MFELTNQLKSRFAYLERFMSIFMIHYNFHYTVRDNKNGVDPFSASRTVYEGTTIPARTISAFGVLYQLLSFIQ